MMMMYAAIKSFGTERGLTKQLLNRTFICEVMLPILPCHHNRLLTQ